MRKEDSDDKRNKDNSWPDSNKPPDNNKKKEEDMKIWGILLFGLIGATATTAAVSSCLSSQKECQKKNSPFILLFASWIFLFLCFLTLSILRIKLYGLLLLANFGWKLLSY